ncbi:MAG: DUF559 domain-containing protein [Candidatus Kapaibacteriales bacterium]
MPYDKYHPNLKERAQELRLSSTFAEKSLWKHVLSKKKTGYGFKRQRPIGHFIADFICQDLKLVIELDGKSHHHPERYKMDKTRDEYLSDVGLKVIRINNDDVIINLEGVAKYIDLMRRERASELDK